MKESENIVKIFVSSRDDHDLVHHLRDSPNLYIHAVNNEQDIESFVHSKVSEAIEEERLLCGKVSERLRRLIIYTLNQKAQGMFRLVSLHIETLCDPQLIKSEENVLMALHRLPKDLERSYSIILDQIQNSEDPNPLIETTFRWLLSAKTTLSSKSLPLAVSFNLSSNVIPSRSVILGVCANLVIYDEESDFFRLALLSVREYLENHEDYDVQRNHGLAAELCLKYLIGDTVLQQTHSLEWSRIFEDYCLCYWIDHVQLLEGRQGYFGSTCSGFYRVKQLLCNWILSAFLLLSSCSENLYSTYGIARILN